MDDISQIPQDLAQEAAKTGKKVVQEVGETLGSLGSQLTGKKPKDPAKIVEELQKREEEFKKTTVSQLLTRLRRLQAEEEQRRKEREEKEKYWEVAQKEKLAPPQIEKSRQAKPLPQVAKQRAETRVGWGTG